MKLIDFLVSSWRGGWKWPNGIGNASCNAGSRDVIFHFDYCPPALNETLIAPRNFDAFDIVTREQYEAALAASKAGWDGEGLPPVGVNAEVFFAADTEPKWHSFLAKFIGENHVIALVGMEEISYKKDELLTSEVKFAPLRSEEVRKHEEITQSILDVLNDYDFELVHIRSDQKRIATDLVERINSGKIPHIRID